VRELKTGYWIVLYVGFSVVFSSLSVSLLGAQQDSMKDTPGWMDTCIQEQTAEQEGVLRCNFKDLPTEYQQRAQRLGYREGDMVEMRRDSSGALAVLPPVEVSNTPEQMREHLLSLVAEKIAQEMTDDIEITAMLALDGTGHFTIRLKFEALYKDLQKQAKKQGFRKGETVAVQVDAETWKYRVLPKEKESKFKFSGNLQEIIPSEEPGGSPSYRIIASYTVLPKDVQKRAKKKGYGKKDSVNFIYREDTKEYKILPPPLVFGIRSTFEKLESEKKVKARSLGYEEGDTVWFTIGRTLMDQPIVPKTKAGSGPLFEIVHAKIESGSNLVFVCDAQFEVLDPMTQKKAREKGHKEGDKVRLNYDTKEGIFEVTSSGVRKSSGRAPAPTTEPKAEMDADAYIARGESYKTKGLNDQAIAEYNKAIEIDPKYAKAYFYRGNAYGSKDLYDKSISDFTKAIEIDPKYARAYFYRGGVYSSKDLYDKAISDFTTAITINPRLGRNAVVFQSRGIAYAHKGLDDEALADFTKQIELTPKGIWALRAYCNRGYIYRKKGLYEQAISDYTEAIQIDPNYAFALFYKAFTYEEAGLINEALEAYKTVLQNVLPKDASYIEKAEKRIKELEK